MPVIDQFFPDGRNPGKQRLVTHPDNAPDHNTTRGQAPTDRIRAKTSTQVCHGCPERKAFGSSKTGRLIAAPLKPSLSLNVMTYFVLKARVFTRHGNNIKRNDFVSNNEKRLVFRELCSIRH
jgi:hypothetical protein